MDHDVFPLSWLELPHFMCRRRSAGGSEVVVVKVHVLPDKGAQTSDIIATYEQPCLSVQQLCPLRL